VRFALDWYPRCTRLAVSITAPCFELLSVERDVEWNFSFEAEWVEWVSVKQQHELKLSSVLGCRLSAKCCLLHDCTEDNYTRSWQEREWSGNRMLARECRDLLWGLHLIDTLVVLLVPLPLSQHCAIDASSSSVWSGIVWIFNFEAEWELHDLKLSSGRVTSVLRSCVENPGQRNEDSLELDRCV